MLRGEMTTLCRPRGELGEGKAIGLCDITSWQYMILKNAVIAEEPAVDPERVIIQMVCNEDEALKLLGTAVFVNPEVVRTIGAAIDRGCES